MRVVMQRILHEDNWKLQKLALLITPEGKANKQQNQAIHFSIGNQNFSTNLVFRSQQILGDKKHVSVQLWLAVH